jgi:hypothetical protein
MTNINLTPRAIGADEGEAPEIKLRQLASDYEAGEIEGLLVAYVMGDGEVKYKLMGALAEKEILPEWKPCGNPVGFSWDWPIVAPWQHLA